MGGIESDLAQTENEYSTSTVQSHYRSGATPMISYEDPVVDVEVPHRSWGAAIDSSYMSSMLRRDTH